MRAFIAINPSADERARLMEATRRLRESSLPVRWLAPEQVHLTLKFLGDVPDQRAAEIAAAVDRVAAGFAPFDMNVRGFGAFPSPRRPSVVWIGIEPEPTLRALYAEVEAAMETLGFEPERRDFRSHLTVGRARRNASRSDFRDLPGLLDGLDYQDRVYVESVELMQSNLKPTGAEYVVVKSAPLAA